MAVRGTAADNNSIGADKEDDGTVIPACIARLLDDTGAQRNTKPSPAST